MAITAFPTPNPNAMKFMVGTDVGGPATYVSGSEASEPWAARLLSLDGVASVFATADFVTVTKRPDTDWVLLKDQVLEVLEDYFSG